MLFALCVSVSQSLLSRTLVILNSDTPQWPQFDLISSLRPCLQKIWGTRGQDLNIWIWKGWKKSVSIQILKLLFLFLWKMLLEFCTESVNLTGSYWHFDKMNLLFHVHRISFHLFLSSSLSLIVCRFKCVDLLPPRLNLFISILLFLMSL
jgi:hypothetical protein